MLVSMLTGDIRECPLRDSCPPESSSTTAVEASMSLQLKVDAVLRVK